jgi:hypothetical protein
MFLVSALASACQALSEDICFFGVLLICIDPLLGVPGGHSRLACSLRHRFYMVCNDLSEMVLELKILFHDKVAIQ